MNVTTLCNTWYHIEEHPLALNNVAQEEVCRIGKMILNYTGENPNDDKEAN